MISTHTYPALIIPAKETSQIKKLLSSILMKGLKNQRDVVSLSDEDTIPESDPNKERKLILQPISTPDLDLESSSTSIYDHPLIQHIFSKYKNDTNTNCIRKATHTVIIGYDEYTTEDILRRILPSSLEIPSAMEMIGSIAHINLRKELLPFQYLIGQIILDKLKCIHLVVNKLDSISNEFRTFPMQVIAVSSSKSSSIHDDDKLNHNHNNDDDNHGSSNRPKKARLDDTTRNNNDTNQTNVGGDTKSSNDSSSNYQVGDICTKLPVQVKEGGSIFHLDFAQVYWNSRLQFEHLRLVDWIGRSIPSSHTTSTTTCNHRPLIVVDACAGVGPFAIPLACRYNQNQIQVYANDLNPISYHYLKINRDKNVKRSSSKNTHLHVYNMDARIFLRQLYEVDHVYYDHVIMNLPAIAPEFLNVFCGLRCYESTATSTNARLPMVHVYCFASKELTYQEDVLKRFQDALGCSLCPKRDEVLFHIVRDVAPNKNMICVHFRLPMEVLSLPRVDTFTSVDGHDV